MRRAFGVLELLIVIVILMAVYFTCFHSKYGRSNPFDDNARVKSQQQLIDAKLQDIENTKALKKRIENNLQEGY